MKHRFNREQHPVVDGAIKVAKGERNVAKGVGANYNKLPSKTRHDIRVFGAGVVTALTVTNWSTIGNFTEKTVDVISNDGGSRSAEQYSDSYPAMFENELATELADELHITAGTYYKLAPETVESVSESGRFVTEDTLVPIFPPAVRLHQDTLENAARANRISPNVFATLATIESGGDTQALSEADAHGLVQVVPRYHIGRYVEHGYLPKDATFEDYDNARNGEPSKISLEDYRKIFTDPEKSTMIGAEYFAECIDMARKANPDLDPHSLVIYARAAGAYNGGPGNAGADFNDLPLESKLYANHVSRIFLDVELAARMREEGMSDREIMTALQSQEMDARAYAYSQIPRDDYASYERSAIALSTPKAGLDPVTGEPQGLAATHYQSYIDGQANIPQSDTGNYTIPLTPGVRIWSSGGGSGLLGRSEANVNWRIEDERD